MFIYYLESCNSVILFMITCYAETSFVYLFIYCLESCNSNVDASFVQHFEDFVAGHFRKYGRNVLVACKAYLDGAQVGCLAGNGVQDVDEGDKSCSLKFKTSLKRLFEELLMEFTVKGADCSKFLSEKAKKSACASASRGPPADTTLRL